MIVDNQQYTLKPGRLFVFPPFKLHKVIVEAGENNADERTTVHLDHQLLDGCLQSFPRRRARFARLWDPDRAAHIEVILEQFNQLTEQQTHQWEEIAMLMLQLIAFMPAQGDTPKTLSRTTASKVMQWIEENYVQKFSMISLSAAVRLSESYISRVFGQETGGSVQDYLATRRVKRACELLRLTDQSVESIGLQYGFADAPYFITRFKKMIGKTPLQYRKAAFSLLQ